MNYILITDYAYVTTRKFFLDEESAISGTDGSFLAARVYKLTSYKETSYGINYSIDESSRINIDKYVSCVN